LWKEKNAPGANIYENDYGKYTVNGVPLKQLVGEELKRKTDGNP